MDRIGTSLAGYPDHARNIEIGLDRPFAFANEIGLVGLEAVKREAIFTGVDCDGAEAQLSCRAKHANGNLAPVGDQKLADFLVLARVHGGDIRSGTATCLLGRFFDANGEKTQRPCGPRRPRKTGRSIRQAGRRATAGKRPRPKRWPTGRVAARQ